MTIRLIALWLLVLTGLAGTPAAGWAADDARAAKAPDVACSPAAAPRADRLAGALGLESPNLGSDEADGTGDGSAADLSAAGLSIMAPGLPSAAFMPRGAGSGLSAGHAFRARAPPSV